MLATRQYTDIMLAIGADHVTALTGVEATALLAVPVLWIAGVLLIVAHKFRTR
jgi:type IV secretory pathway TrbD component